MAITKLLFVARYMMEQAELDLLLTLSFLMNVLRTRLERPMHELWPDSSYCDQTSDLAIFEVVEA